jgi:hypothetical protein
MPEAIDFTKPPSHGVIDLLIFKLTWKVEEQPFSVTIDIFAIFHHVFHAKLDAANPKAHAGVNLGPIGEVDLDIELKTHPPRKLHLTGKVRAGVFELKVDLPIPLP